jgi:sulfate-transporting ATPase
LFETMTVYENLRTAADVRSKRSAVLDLWWPSRPHLDGFAAAAVREFELEPFLGRRPDELPYGVRRLVAIARAVASGPSVLLLDEPAAGLDDQERAELSGLIRRLADRWGIAVVLVEHDLQLVFDVCDRITVLDQGRQIATGTPSEIRDNPRVIAAYLGSHVTDEAAPTTVVSGKQQQRPYLGSSHGPLLRVTELHAGYGDLAAVRDLNLEVAAGEIVALLGPNGAGKTTTLLTLAGELNPIRGEVEIFGNHTRLPLHRLAREGLSFVAAERSLTSALTTRANLRLGRGSVSRALELFPEIEGFQHRRAGLLSGGEQQMVTLARALAAEPKVLLVDELSLGLAPMITERLLSMVRSAADNGVAVVLVEQHTADALAIADRVVVLRNGQVALSCSAEEIGADRARLEAAYLSGTVPELESQPVSSWSPQLSG